MTMSRLVRLVALTNNPNPAQAAIIAYSSQAASAATSMTVLSHPTGTQTTSLIILSANSDDNQAAPTSVTNYTNIAISGNRDELAVFRKTDFSGSVSGNLPVFYDNSSTDAVSAAAMAFTGVFDISAGVTVDDVEYSGAAFSTSAMSCSVDKSIHVIICSIRRERDSNTPSFMQTPTGYTRWFDLLPSTQDQPVQNVFYKLVDAGSVGGVSLTPNSTNDEGCVVSFCVNGGTN